MYEGLWKNIVRDEHLSLSCIFFPDKMGNGQPHNLFGKHSIECKCMELYQRTVPWGCQWYQHWQTKTDEAYHLGKTLVVVFKQGKKDVKIDGLGQSQRGEVAWLDKNNIPYESLDISGISFDVSGRCLL